MGLRSEMVERRRLVFWMVYKTDAWQVRIFYASYKDIPKNIV
jgi:hypothetical protein